MQALTQSTAADFSATPRGHGRRSAASSLLSLVMDRLQPWAATATAACSALVPQADARRPGREVPAEQLDPSTGLYNKAGLVVHGNALLAKARREGRALAMAVFDCADLLEVRSIYGSPTARKLMKVLVGKLYAVAGGRGLVARTGSAQFVVLVPAAGRDKALAAIHKALGSPMRIEFDAGDEEIVLVPEVAVDMVKPEVRGIETVLDVLRGSLHEAWACEERRRVYLRRERERHSHPMELDAAVPSVDMRAGLQATRAQAATIPAPLRPC
jgi:GGDEF domain-containing protein